MKIKGNAGCPCGSGKKYQQCCGIHSFPERKKRYISEAHEWMDKNILHGRNPDLHGYLVLVEHNIPAGEIWNQLKFWTEQYLYFGENRTRICHRIIDRLLESRAEADEQDGYPQSFCHKGCSNCCFQPVACTDEEAQLIYRHCAENGIYIDFEKLERQRRFMESDSCGNFTGTVNWNKQDEGDQSCIFLNTDDRTCRIWEIRPFVCRVHLAGETDRYCRTYNDIPDPDSIGIHYPECSYILSSIFTVHHDSIGKMMGQLLLDRKYNEYNTILN